jgi:ribose 5-phosphate isomerase B
MKICIDSDETGAPQREALIDFIASLGHLVRALSYPVGNYYPDMSMGVAHAVQKGYYDRGIILCGTGQGVAMMANKVRGIYACPCYHAEWAPKLARNYNAQVLTLGCQINTLDEMKAIVKAYLDTPFEPRPNMIRMRELEDMLYDDTPNT